MTDARFRVASPLFIGARPLFFLLGEIAEGELRLGMVATAGPRHRPVFREAIHAIEFVDRRPAGTAQVALGFRYRDRDELVRWRRMDWDGQTLIIPTAPILYPCACCGFRTMLDEERGSYDICPVCGWEDDAVQFRDPDYRGGANDISLTEARARFAARRSRDLAPDF